MWETLQTIGGWLVTAVVLVTFFAIFFVARNAINRKAEHIGRRMYPKMPHAAIRAMHLYQKLSWSIVKWVASAFSVAAGLMLLLILYDLQFGPLWGYQRSSALVALVQIAVGLVFRHGAINALRRLERKPPPS